MMRRVFGGLLRLFGFGRPRVTEKLNTVDFDDVLDNVEMLEEIEGICGIKIQDSEASEIYAVGDLYDVVQRKTAENAEFDPVWEMVVQVVRAYSGSRDPIDRDTTFFAKDARKRSPDP